MTKRSCNSLHCLACWDASTPPGRGRIGLASWAWSKAKRRANKNNEGTATMDAEMLSPKKLKPVPVGGASCPRPALRMPCQTCSGNIPTALWHRSFCQHEPGCFSPDMESRGSANRRYLSKAMLFQGSSGVFVHNSPWACTPLATGMPLALRKASLRVLCCLASPESEVPGFQSWLASVGSVDRLPFSWLLLRISHSSIGDSRNVSVTCKWQKCSVFQFPVCPRLSIRATMAFANT